MTAIATAGSTAIDIPDLPDTARMYRECGARLRNAMKEKGVDALVLLGNGNVVYATGVSWRLLDAAGVVEKFGVPPRQIADYLAIVGDTSDNIPGLDGVGPKTASKWLQQFGSVEGVIAHAGELKPDRFQELVRVNADNLRRNLKITTLTLTHPTVPAQKVAVSPEALFQLLEELEMKSSLADARKRYAQPELF